MENLWSKNFCTLSFKSKEIMPQTLRLKNKLLPKGKKNHFSLRLLPNNGQYQKPGDPVYKGTQESVTFEFYAQPNCP